MPQQAVRVGGGRDPVVDEILGQDERHPVMDPFKPLARVPREYDEERKPSLHAV